MTHSNHRRGSRESLDNDYVVLIRGDKVKERPDLAQIVVEILAKHNPIGVIKRRTGIPLRYVRNWENGLTLEELVNDPAPPTYIAGVYESKRDIETLIKELEQAELGFSVVVSGVFENTFDACNKTELAYPHTVNMSMETIGRTEKLPDKKILELITMCGHSLVGEHLCQHLIDRVRKGKMTADEAGLELGKNCVCNFFNSVRAAKIIEEYTTLQR